MTSFRDLGEAAAHLSTRELPFVWYAMGPLRESITFEVAPQDGTAATDYFAKHPLVLADGAQVPVVVTPRRGESWVSPPADEVVGRRDEFDYERLVGLGVDDAARQANLSGWSVRAHEREAAVTADHNPGRLNLCYGDDRVVESVSRG